jgi:octaprenyl-diphosphate synthase
VEIVRATGALEIAHEAAAAEARRAMSAAEQLPANAHAQALLQLAASLLARRN